LKSNDRQTFVTQTASKYGKRLRGYVAARVRNASDVSDRVQEVFMRLLRMDQHEPIRNAGAYLMTIAAHVLQQHHVRRAAAPESLETLLDSQLGSSPSPEAQGRLQALDRILESAVRSGSVRTEEVVLTVFCRQHPVSCLESSAEMGHIRKAPAVRNIADQAVRLGNIGKSLTASFQSASLNESRDRGVLAGQHRIRVAHADTHGGGYGARAQRGIGEVRLYD
jgi:DNA-directed RNA polymerase specialized sigma24 family protein